MAAAIKGDALEMLRSMIAPHDTAEMRARYVAGDFPRSDGVVDLNARYRWDTFYRAERADWGATRDFYARLHDAVGRDITDAMLATALRTIIPDVR